MAFRIERNDITKVHADAIVNTANPEVRVGSGTDSAIYEAAGKEKLLEARTAIGKIAPGSSVYTPSFNLSRHKVKYIIHTAGFPYVNGSSDEENILRNCYKTALNLSKELKCKSVALPLLASGNYGYPKDLAFKIAVEEINNFLVSLEDDLEMDVILVVYDNESFTVSEMLYGEINNYLEESVPPKNTRRRRILYDFEDYETTEGMQNFVVSQTKSRYSKPITSRYNNIKFDKTENESLFKDKSLDDFLIKNKSMDFRNTLQKMIADKGLSNAFVYKKANLKKQYFSDIINPKNEDYVPKKNAVLSLGLALELSLNEFEDFLSIAGYSLKASSTFDMIVKYCIIHKRYNIIEVNLILFDRVHKTLDVSSK